MKIKELSLWLFFLLLCFGAGYYKGSAPSDSGSSFLGGPTEVEILLTDEMLFPVNIRETLQKKLNIQIKTLIVHDREEFAIRTITSPGYHLALIPEHWLEPANLAHQMSNLNPLMDLISDRISADFLKLSAEKIYSAPLFWMVTSLKKKNEGLSPVPLIPKKFYFLKDWDQLTTKSADLGLDLKSISPWDFFKPYPPLTAGTIYEVTHLDSSLSLATSQLTNSDLNYSSLYIWSLCTPRHSPSRKLTLKLIEALSESDLQLKWLEQIPLASTLKKLNEASLPRNKKAIFIRDMDLSHLKKPRNLSLEQLKQIKIDLSRN